MNHLDPGEEERRLREQYAQMNEDELQAVADYGYELTEIARTTLQSEISQRGLNVKLRDAPPAAPAAETLDESDDLLDSPQPEPEDTEEPEEEEDYVAVCPKCHSSEIVFQGRDAEPATGSTNESKFNWSCDACGHQWKDDGIEEEA